MKKLKISTCFGLLFGLLVKLAVSAAAAEPLLEDPITFYEAVQSGKVKFSVTGNGGYNGESLSLKITNVTRRPMIVSVEPGTRFKSTSDWMQDLIITQEALLAMHPLRESRFGLFTMCTQHSNASPSKGEKFVLENKAEGPLLALAKTIDKYGYQNSSAQSAVWAVVDHTSCANVYGTDMEMVKRLRKIVGEATDEPCDLKNMTPREHTITSLSISMEHLLKKTVAQASLALYGENGTLVKQYFAGQPLKPGFYHFKVGFHHTFGDSAQFILKLEEDDEVIYQKSVAIGDSIPNLATLPKDIFANFEMKQAEKVRIGIYDELGELYILLADDHKLLAGMNRVNFSGGRDLPPGKKYFLQVRKGAEILVTQEFPLGEGAPKFNPMVKRGTFRVTLADPLSNARLEVVDLQGKVVWVVFDKSVLGHGPKNIPYVFQHTQGPQAQFILRLLDGKGRVVKEQQTRGR